MKVYISGRISGLDLATVAKRFYSAQSFIESLGHEALNPLDNKVKDGATWSEHMVADIEMLLQADAIYMLPDWRDSTGARIEHNIAMETQKSIHYCDLI